RPDAKTRHHDGGQDHEQPVAAGKFDEPGNHGLPPLSSDPPKLCSAARKLLSASMRKLADVTTLSPALRPSVTSTQSLPCTPRRTGRGSKRPSPRSISTA